MDWKIMRTFAAELKQKRMQAWSDWQQMHGGGATQDSKSREKWAVCIAEMKYQRGPSFLRRASQSLGTT